jgi:hypothetical protein
MNLPLDDHTVGADDQKPPEGSLTHLGRRTEPLLAFS